MARVFILTWTERPWHGTDAYAETKLHDVLLAFAVARSATTPKPRLRASTSITSSSAHRIQPPAMRRDRIDSWQPASVSRASRFGPLEAGLRPATRLLTSIASCACVRVSFVSTHPRREMANLISKRAWKWTSG
jgi:hypothetical protein